jgi:hypothetical protein
MRQWDIGTMREQWTPMMVAPLTLIPVIIAIVTLSRDTAMTLTQTLII